VGKRIALVLVVGVLGLVPFVASACGESKAVAQPSFSPASQPRLLDIGPFSLLGDRATRVMLHATKSEPLRVFILADRELYSVALRRVADADGYFLNVTTSEPSVFVMWRLEAERAVPRHVTVSYSEASSWMEGGENVDRVPMPPDILAWVRDFVVKNYRPQPKKKIRPQSFKSPRERARH